MPIMTALLSEPPIRFVCRALLKAGLGPWSERALFDALPYTQYATGLVVASRYATLFNEKEIAAIEFGVAGGNGLLALADHAKQIKHKTGIDVRVVGFDTGNGLPPSGEWRDAPWLYNPGDYPGDEGKLRERLAGRAELILGNIGESFPRWLCSGNLPIGFMSIDVDYYSSTAAILKALTDCDASALLPICSVYLDDILCFGVPRCAGELAAVEEFNRNPLRQFDRADWIGEMRPYKEAHWLKRMFDLYCFDHPKMRSHNRRATRRLDLSAE